MSIEAAVTVEEMADLIAWLKQGGPISPALLRHHERVSLGINAHGEEELHLARFIERAGQFVAAFEF